MLSTDRQTDKLTNATKNITSFAKEVIINLLLLSSTSDPRQITGNMSVVEMPLALYSNLLRNI